MISLLTFDRRLWLPLLLGASACQTPGEDWVDPAGALGTSAGTTANGNLTADGTPSTTGTATVTSGGDTTTDSATSGGGSSSTGDGGASSDSTSDTSSDSTSDATSDSTTNASGGSTSDSTSDTSSTTGMGGTGGVPEGSLIDNGDFSEGERGWEIEGDANVDVSGGEYCMTLNNAGTVYLDWPTEFEPASLQSGTSYVFSYVVYYSGDEPSVSVKLGQPVEPYNAFAEGPIDASTSPMKFMQTFDMDSDDQAGIRFTIDGPSGSKVCVDNVALVAD